MIPAPIFLKFESKKSTYSKLRTPEFALKKSHCCFWDSQFCLDFAPECTATWDLFFSEISVENVRCVLYWSKKRLFIASHPHH